MTTPAAPRIGFVGLGAIGRPMALHLLEAVPALWVYDVTPGPVDELTAAGARPTADLAELARAVDVVCVMVRDDEQVGEVLDQLLAAERPAGGTADGSPLVVVVHSTVAPETPARLAEQAERRGVLLVDAPVSGGALGAAAGTLAIMVGGSPEAFGAARPVLDVLGTLVVHAGPIGAGTRMKLARNLVHFVSFTAVTEAQRLAEAAGLDLAVLGEVVRHTDAITGGPGAIMYRESTGPLAEDDFWHGVLGHVAALGRKDLTHAVALAEELGVDTPLARLALTDLAPGLGLPPQEQR